MDAHLFVNVKSVLIKIGEIIINESKACFIDVDTRKLYMKFHNIEFNKNQVNYFYSLDFYDLNKFKGQLNQRLKNYPFKYYHLDDNVIGVQNVKATKHKVIFDLIIFRYQDLYFSKLYDSIFEKILEYLNYIDFVKFKSLFDATPSYSRLIKNRYPDMYKGLQLINDIKMFDTAEYKKIYLRLLSGNQINLINGKNIDTTSLLIYNATLVSLYPYLIKKYYSFEKYMDKSFYYKWVEIYERTMTINVKRYLETGKIEDVKDDLSSSDFLYHIYLTDIPINSIDDVGNILNQLIYSTFGGNDYSFVKYYLNKDNNYIKEFIDIIKNERYYNLNMFKIMYLSIITKIIETCL